MQKEIQQFELEFKYPAQNEKQYQVVCNPSFASGSLQSLEEKPQEGNNNKNKISDEKFQEIYHYDKKTRVNDDIKAKSSYKAASMTMVKAYFGSGILALPYCFNQAGWLLSTLIFLFSAFILMKCVYALLEVAAVSKQKDAGLPELADSIYGNRGVIIVRVLLISYQMGKCTAGLLFFIQFFSYVVNNENNDNFIYVLFALCIVVPMGFIDNMALFTKFSLIANIFQLSTLASVIFYSFYMMFQGDNFESNFSNVMVFNNFPIIIGVSVYGMGFIPLLLPIKNSMNKQEQFLRVNIQDYLIDFKLFNVVSYISVMVYIIFCPITVWAFGQNITQIFLFTLGRGTYAYIAQISYSIAIILSYPVQLLPALQQIEKWHIFQNYVNPDLKYSKFRRLLIRFVINVILALIAYSIPSFAYFINILGAIGGAAINIILPILYHYRVFYNSEKALSKAAYIGIFSYGIIGGLCAFIYSIIKLSQH